MCNGLFNFDEPSDSGHNDTTALRLYDHHLQ